MLNKKSVDDINVKGQRVLVRCDFNVPLKEERLSFAPTWASPRESRSRSCPWRR